MCLAIFRGDYVKSMGLREAIEPMCSEVCSASCVLYAALAWAGTVESASGPRGDRAFEGESKRTTMFLKTVKLYL